jgi:hypothetical protein
MFFIVFFIVFSLHRGNAKESSRNFMGCVFLGG